MAFIFNLPYNGGTLPLLGNPSSEFDHSLLAQVFMKSGHFGLPRDITIFHLVHLLTILLYAALVAAM